MHRIKSRLIISVLILSAFFAAAAHASAAAVTGWAWSGTDMNDGDPATIGGVGWISFNSADVGAGGGPYSVVMDDGTGALSGYAWSSNIGWISFNAAHVVGCPVGSCNPTINRTTGAVTGWARACAGTLNPNTCSGGSRADGWDGWIELSGANHPSPGSGVTYNTGNGAISGFAWGGDGVGWIEFFASAAGSLGRVNSQRVDSSGTAYINGTQTRLDTGSWVSTNPNIFLNVSGGQHDLYASYLAGYSVTTASVCWAAIGVDCTAPFTTAVINTGSEYRVPSITVNPGQVTRVRFKYDALAPSVSLRVKGPEDADYTTSPKTITTGQTVSIRWSSQNVVGCSAFNNTINSQPPEDTQWNGSVAINTTGTLAATDPLTNPSGYEFHLECEDTNGEFILRTVQVITQALACSFSPPNTPTSPVVGKPVTLTVTVTGGTPPYDIHWTDGEGLDYTDSGLGLGSHSITRVYSTSGFRDVNVRVTDSLGSLQVCALTAEAGPNPKVRPKFEEF